MAGYYNKDDLKEQLELENIYDLLNELGGEPEYSDNGLIAQTICHNAPGDGSRKLYYYENSGLFKCYTDCDEAFDIFELIIKSKKIQNNIDWELYDAMDYVAGYFGFEGAKKPEELVNAQYWEIFKRHDISKPIFNKKSTLKAYNPIILTKFAYPRIQPWEKENISPDICKYNLIGYYPGNNQITIPHFDAEGRLIGVRGRYLASDDAERYGKYRPLKINDVLYNHPLSMNLYNLNKSKENIKARKTAIIFESEKACLQFQSYYGKENDISVACCGSSISNYQIELLEQLGVSEIIIAFDRQFQEIGDDEFKRLKRKLINIYKKFGNRIRITAIFDKNKLLPYKASPTDISKEVFETLLAERIVPTD